MSSNKDIPIMELARVVEVAGDHWFEEQGYPPARAFDATCTDGSVCHVITGGCLPGEAPFCARHDDGNGNLSECEGCVRVMCVLTDEKLRSLKMTLVGYAITGKDKPLQLVEA